MQIDRISIKYLVSIAKPGCRKRAFAEGKPLHPLVIMFLYYLPYEFNTTVYRLASPRLYCNIGRDPIRFIGCKQPVVKLFRVPVYCGQDRLELSHYYKQHISYIYSNEAYPCLWLRINCKKY